MYQLSIEYFWPLTEQIPLDLDYTGCEKPKLEYSNPTGFTILDGGTWGTTTISNAIAPTLSVSPVNPVGYLELGPLHVGQEKKPNILQRYFFKLLGFNWKDK